MKEIGDDPIVRCMERSGYPPWMIRGGRKQERETDRGEDDNGKKQ